MVDSIVSTCKTYWSTPSANTPIAINTAIKNIYNAGVNNVSSKVIIDRTASNNIYSGTVPKTLTINFTKSFSTAPSALEITVCNAHGYGDITGAWCTISNLDDVRNDISNLNVEVTKYTNKITLSSSKFEITNQELIYRGDGFVYIRFSGETLQEISAGSTIILGYVNSEFVDYYSKPATCVVGLTSWEDGQIVAMLYGTSSEDGYSKQIRCKTTGKINKGAHIYITLYYYLNKS